MIPPGPGTDPRTVGVALVAAACGLGALAALAVGAGPAWPVVLTAIGAGAVASVVVASRIGAVDLLVGAGVAASCADAVRIGPTGLFDVLCAAGVVAVGVDAVLRRDVPVRWPARACWVSACGFATATILVTAFPPDPSYLVSRFELADGPAGAGDPAVTGGTEVTDLSGLVRLLVGLLAVPFVLGRYARGVQRLTRIGRAFLAGAAVSCLVAVSDYVGATAVGETLNGYANGDDRVNGLTTQPNQLALTAAMALPFAWFVVGRRHWRVALSVLLLVGIGVSGSRAGLIGAAVALLACAAWRYRAGLLLFGLPAAAAGALALSELLSFTRFGTEGAADSDVQRARLLEQGYHDVLESPLFGIGLRVSQEAHVVYLQLLASTGLVGLLSFALLYGTAFAVVHRLRRTPVVLAAGVALATYLVVAAASNAVLVRYVFVPLAIVFVGGRLLLPGPAPAEPPCGVPGSPAGGPRRARTGPSPGGPVTSPRIRSTRHGVGPDPRPRTGRGFA